MTIRQYLIEACQDDARRAGERDRLLLEAPPGASYRRPGKAPGPAAGPSGGRRAAALPGLTRANRTKPGPPPPSRRLARREPQHSPAGGAWPAATMPGVLRHGPARPPAPGGLSGGRQRWPGAQREHERLV